MSQRRFRVVWTEVASQDVERLAGYLGDEAPLRADHILERIISRGESLESSPSRGRRPPQLRSVGDRTWREVHEPPCRLIYRLVGGAVEIHAVLDGRRDLDDILLERILQG